MPSSIPVAEPLESLSDPLVLVSDTTTEAERLIASLRARGFRVRDVPLMLLAGRVESQHPNLVVCDGSSAKLVEALKRMRTGTWGKQVDVLLLGGDPTELKEGLTGIVVELQARLFARPIDVYSILQTVEECIGSPLNRPAFAGVSMAALPRLQHQAPTSVRDSGQPRGPTPIPHRRSSGPAPSIRLPSGALLSQNETVVPGRPGSARPVPADDIAPAQPPPQFPVAHVSRELEHLLENAEHRLGPVAHSLQPPGQPVEHMTPEAELDAILPPDVLAALEEPLELDEGEETSSPGTRPGERSRFRSNIPPSAPMFERDTGTGRSASKPGGTFAAIGTGSLAPANPTTLAGTTPIPTSKGSFLPVPSVLQHSTGVGDYAPPPESLPPATVLQPPRRSIAAEEDTDAPLQSQRHRTEAEAAADVSTPMPLIDDNSDQNSTAPPMANHSRPPVEVDFDAKEPTRPPARVSRGRSPIPRVTSSPPGRERSLAPKLDKPAPGPAISIPTAIGPGDVVRALAELIRSRFSGAFLVEDDLGVRRVVLRDGDFVMVASGIEGESLVAFLIQRGDLSAEAARLERKLPQFGRHAGAALIAHGHLRQDELWPVLRAHAEWLLGKTLGVERGSGDLETELPARLLSEPAVFGGATGAEVLIETLRRVVTPEQALHSLGGLSGRLAVGQYRSLLNECALSNQESHLVEQCPGKTVSQVMTEAGSNDFAAALQALAALGVLSVLAPTARDIAAEKVTAPRDAFDDSAIRARIGLRRALVEEGDYFAFLGVDREATGYQIRHAYLDLRREFDPSTLLTAATAQLRDDVDVILEVLDEAYEVLRDAPRRERYRRALASDPR